MATNTTFRFLKYSALIFGGGLLLNACITPPDYPDTPSIEFKSIKSQRFSDAEGTRDTITITVSFKDGDGDLGLNVKEKNPEDSEPPYQQYNADNTPNRFYNNYFFQPFLKDADGVFQPKIFSSLGEYNSRYPRLTTTDRSEPIKGDLSFKQAFDIDAFASGSEVRFEVSIVDRALHESNKVTTSSIIIP